ncbi:hypothetical protein K458DRAFT_393707 [Lentithecium fluviatile CBS 122367]|uniref:Uncharacterized protein n=1 Tax=Lentithecium fluviatile CBS 122367 TaxID=1168545 RepID=A0A6G1IMV7_9PLEO|nr:hypothetical protein K458DRAFT_393707 [Lentithecium fluviatile CBS 122367]
MRTKSFVHSMQWLEDVVKILLVKERRKIFVITGTATTTTSFRQVFSQRGLNLGVGVDATAFTGVPISAGPEVGRKTEERVSDGETAFAFQVREVWVRRKEGVRKHSVITKSALFSQERNEVEVEGLSEDLGGKEFDLQTTVVEQAIGEDDDDEGVEDVVCVMPNDVWLDDTPL